MIEHRQLRYFLVLAETLHFGRAAEAVHITQPSLSRQIASLEGELGTTLFARHSRSVVLTAAGQEFYRLAKESILALDSAVRSTRAVSRGERGELRVAFTAFMAWTVLPRLMQQYMDSYPDVIITLNELLPIDLARSVETGESDLALTLHMADSETLRYRPVYQEELCAAISNKHPLAQADHLDVSQLKDDPFILSSRKNAPALYDSVIQICRSAGFEPQVRIQTHLQQTIVNLVAGGLGVSIVPASMKKINLPGAVFLPITTSSIVEFGVAWREHNDNPCLAHFLALSH